MKAIFELMPAQTDTPEEVDALIKAAQEYAKATAEEDDFFCECPDDKEENELLEESSSIIAVDDKKKEFTYLSSFNKNGNMISFGQDNLGLWWYFYRTGIASGRGLKGPFTNKDKLLKAMESVDA